MTDSETSERGAADPPDAPASVGQGEVASASFFGLLLVVFLGAANDNVFRWLVIGIGKQYVTPDNVRNVLMAGSVAFVVPYLVLAAPAGYLADRFSKRTVIVAFKALEIAIMSLGIVAILLGNLYLLFAIVALMGAQSALFGPAKAGAIPEIVRPGRISAANGLIGLTSVVATVVGMALGCWLTDITGHQGRDYWWYSAIALVGLAIIGWACSLLIQRLPQANPERLFPANPISIARQSWRDLQTLASSRALLRVALGIAFFWSLGALAQMNIDQYAFEGGATLQRHVIPLLVSLVFGVGFGCVLAGVWSAGRVELGILPIGAFGIMVSSLLLFTVQGVLIDPVNGHTTAYVFACVFLVFLGISAGLFDVPLQAYIQHRSPPKHRGSVLAASNLITFGCMLVIFLMFSGLRVPYHQGSFANVILPTLDAGQQMRVQAEVQQFREHRFENPPQGNGPAQIEDYVAGTEGDYRRVMLANLLWAELEGRRARGETVTYEAYQQRFPNDLGILYDVYNQFTGLPLFSASQIFLLCSVLTVPVFIYIVWLIPEALIRFVVWLASKTLYRIRVEGLDNLPQRGGALLVSNHISWLDGVLLLLVSSRPIRMVTYSGNFQNRIFKWMASLFGSIMLENRPKAIVRALKTAREALNGGELVCIFPEGGISRSGQLQAFKPGVMKILEGTDAPVIPIYIDELWGSIFSFQGGRFLWKWPRKIPYPITIHIGPPVEHADDAHHIRQAVAKLGAQAVQDRSQRMQVLPHSFIRSCKKRKYQSKVADSSGANLTGGMLLLRTLILRRLLRRHALGADEQYVGVFVPPSAGGFVTNMALALDKRIAVNLNYTLDNDVLNYCIQQCGIKHVITSRMFMSKMNFDLQAELVYLEDFKDKPTAGDKFAAAMDAFFTPAAVLERKLGLREIKSDDVLTVIFTSGSTGMPKGVILTHGNVATNVDAIDQIVHLNKNDVIVGVLPLFHSFGFTITMWSVAGLNIKGVYHYSPLDHRRIGKICKEHQGTILLATPTFLRNYLRRCKQEDLTSLDVVVAGAEKLPTDLVEKFEQKFSVRPVEGYGCTELSPLVSVNVPPSRAFDSFQKGIKEGSVGRPVPGVTAKIVDLESGQELSTDESGMLLIKGPNVMKGYLNQNDKTGEVINDGWYTTGDVAQIDNEGFITITGRISRFSKIGGEMVPHVKIEEAINSLLDDDQDHELQAAVTCVPDERKGERLVVFHKNMEKSPQQLCAGLRELGLPNLFIPSPDSFIEIDEFPVLGTGKLDLMRLQEMAKEQFTSTSDSK